jgi:hypothetical protein
MNCTRCHGLMVPARLQEEAEARYGETSSGWRCLLCGEVVDYLIMANRNGDHESIPQRIS